MDLHSLLAGVHVLCRAGNPEEAQKMIADMRARGTDPGVQVLTHRFPSAHLHTVQSHKPPPPPLPTCATRVSFPPTRHLRAMHVPRCELGSEQFVHRL